MKTRLITVALLLLSTALCNLAFAGETTGPVAIAIHAGAGTIKREDMSAEDEAFREYQKESFAMRG